MKALQTGTQHRAVGLIEDAGCEMHDAIRIDTKQVAVERQMMDCAERKTVNNRSDAFWFRVGHDVGCLHKLALAQGAYRDGAGTRA